MTNDPNRNDPADSASEEPRVPDWRQKAERFIEVFGGIDEARKALDFVENEKRKKDGQQDDES